MAVLPVPDACPKSLPDPLELWQLAVCYYELAKKGDFRE